MSIPTQSPDAPRAPAAGPAGWSTLSPGAKRERILSAAIAVFGEHGLEAPMHEVARVAGAGVASIYRIFPSKHDLWAAIVIRRLGELEAVYAAAEDRPGDRFTALVEVLRNHVRIQSPEPFFVEARTVVEDRPEVAEAVARTTAVQERVLAAARAEGRLRPDATVEDMRLLFAATRAARRMDPRFTARMFELMIAGLERPRE